ncbi:MAG: YceI family protein [Bacteroidia bacterium]
MKSFLLTAMAGIFLGLLFAPGLVYGQKFIVTGETAIFVTGTSTLHDWKATVGKVSGHITLDKAFTKKASPAKGSTISEGTVSFEVKSMDGGRGAVMNDKIFNAFDAEKNPNIIFTLSKAVVSAVEADGTFTVDISGNLTMAGQTKPVTFPMKGKKEADGKYHFTGEKSVDMTAYGIEPPSAMFGQIETGKDVTIHFNLFFGV